MEKPIATNLFAAFQYCILIFDVLSTDENAAIVKCSDHMIKVKDIFLVLEGEALTKAGQLPQFLTKNSSSVTEANLKAIETGFTPTCASCTH